jgi:hypothetical protein
MSKSKKKAAKPVVRQRPKLFRDLQWCVRGRVSEIKEHLSDPDFIFKGLPPALNKATSEAADNLARAMIDNMPEWTKATADQRTGVRVVASLAAEMGFAMALYRFADSLRGESELSEWQKQGQRKGHETQSEQREARYQRIRDKWAAMESAGVRVTNETVAAAVREDGEKRCSARTVQRAFAAAEQQSRPTKRAKR